MTAARTSGTASHLSLSYFFQTTYAKAANGERIAQSRRINTSWSVSRLLASVATDVRYPFFSPVSVVCNPCLMLTTRGSATFMVGIFGWGRTTLSKLFEYKKQTGRLPLIFM